MTKLSVIIITKNEAHNIEDCLKSVSFADEIVVFDSGSTDDTTRICQLYTPLVTQTEDWPGDGPQKNRALAKAQGEWVLCLDADERVSAELAKEILAIIQSPNAAAAYQIPFQSTYCNRIIRHGDWSNESHVRLFQKAKAQITPDIVHCHVKTDGQVGRLKGAIIHHPFQQLNTLLQKMNDYSTQSARTLFKKGKKASLWTALSHGLWAFTRGYLLKLGFLDGREGFMLAMSNAQGTYYRYLKLMYLWEDQKAGVDG